VIIDDELPDQSALALAAELRALQSHLPLVITSRKHALEIEAIFADDPCVAVLARPFAASDLDSALRGLEVTCVKQP
jgi:DNA-binding response OmpR family regulator